jgi:hypothetical protein
MSDSQWVEPNEVICCQADEITALKAERDKLREIFIEQSEQIQRLRAALEDIRDSGAGTAYTQNLARRVLGGK